MRNVRDIRVWRYELVPKRWLSAIARGESRHGALISVDGGFADVHPWPELGDATLDEQLARLARGETTPLLERSLDLASIDGRARVEGKSVFEGLTIPASHWPAGAGIPPDGFDTVKIKLGPLSDPNELLPFAGYKLRLDFNATLDAIRFENFMRGLPAGLDIDFVEDPTPYDAAMWRRLQEMLGCRLALDRREATEGVDVLVLKPAIQRWPDGVEQRAGAIEYVITSYMDHPLGQLGAAYIAAMHRHQISERCGLITHVLYEADDFIDRMQLDGAQLRPPEGAGFGFDDLLDKLPWKPLT